MSDEDQGDERKRTIDEMSKTEMTSKRVAKRPKPDAGTVRPLSFLTYSLLFCIFNLTVVFADPARTLPKPCNAGLIDIEWVIEDFTKSEVQQSWWTTVLRILKVPPCLR